jgi:hypothetical protein
MLRERVVSKLVLARLAFSGGLVAVAIAEVLGLSADIHSQAVAGTIGIVSVVALKLAHLI